MRQGIKFTKESKIGYAKYGKMTVNPSG